MKLTKGELFEKLKDFPDDIPIIMFNIDDGEHRNWDTGDVELMNDAYMCKGYEGCKHI